MARISEGVHFNMQLIMRSLEKKHLHVTSIHSAKCSVLEKKSIRPVLFLAILEKNKQKGWNRLEKKGTVCLLHLMHVLSEKGLSCFL